MIHAAQLKRLKSIMKLRSRLHLHAFHLLATIDLPHSSALFGNPKL